MNIEIIWEKHLRALSLRNKFGDKIAEKYWNELVDKLKKETE
jgi:hypothetical protein